MWWQAEPPGAAVINLQGVGGNDDDDDEVGVGLWSIFGNMPDFYEGMMHDWARLVCVPAMVRRTFAQVPPSF